MFLKKYLCEADNTPCTRIKVPGVMFVFSLDFEVQTIKLLTDCCTFHKGQVSRGRYIIINK